MKKIIIAALTVYVIIVLIMQFMVIHDATNKIQQKNAIIEKQDSLINDLQSRIYPEILGDTIVKLDPKFKYLRIRFVAK